MNRRQFGILPPVTSWVVVAAVAPPMFGQPKPHRENVTTSAREIILASTNHALAALVNANQKSRLGRLHINDVGAYVAVVRPDFQQLDSRRKVIGLAKDGQRNWAGVFSLTTAAPIQGEAMRLLEATSTITHIHMLSRNEALVTGEESFHWIGANERVLESRQASGSVAVIPNTEQRYVTNVSLRRWVRGKDGRWGIQSSCTVSTKQVSTL